MAKERTILVVDDGTDVVTALGALKDQGYEIRQAARWTEAIAEIQDRRPDAVLLDLYLPNVQGEALLEFIRDLDPNLPVVIVSSEIEPSKLDQLGRLGANGFVRKRFSEDDLFLVVEQILSQTVEEPVPEVEEPVGEKDLAAPAEGSESPKPSKREVESPQILPGAGYERIERVRPEVTTGPARRTHRRAGRRRRGMRVYVVAFFLCLLGTWVLFTARGTLSQGFFGMDISDTREEE